MYGHDQLPEYDAHCESCGAGYWFEVGLMITCDSCGGPLQKPDPQSYQPHPDDDVLLDADYIAFNSVKAFRLLKQLGRLKECLDL